MRSPVGHSGTSKVIYFGTNGKRVCNFLLVGHSNLGPILDRFTDIAVFRSETDQLYSTRILGVFPTVPIGSDRRCLGQPEPNPSANQL